MNENEIVSMWGYADEYEIEFTRHSSGCWQTNIPPDIEDGQYAVEIHAVSANGYLCLWTGILYMNQGQHCLHIYDTKYTIWMHLSATDIRQPERMVDIEQLDIATQITLRSSVYSMELRRCCRHE